MARAKDPNAKVNAPTGPAPEADAAQGEFQRESDLMNALNLQFEDKAAEEAYQVHPLHLDFVEQAFKPNCVRAVIYDFA